MEAGNELRVARQLAMEEADAPRGILISDIDGQCDSIPGFRR
jgi:hypothetical protein